MIVIKEPTSADVKKIILDNEIYRRISYGKNISKARFVKKYYDRFLKDFIWWGCYLDDKIIGLANYEESGRFHFQILKKYRFYSSIALKKALSKIDKNLFCEIPHIYKDVINFAKKNNFAEKISFRQGKYLIYRLEYELN